MHRSTDLAQALSFVLSQCFERDEGPNANGEAILMGITTGKSSGCAAGEGLLRDLHLPVMGPYDNVVFRQREEP